MFFTIVTVLLVILMEEFGICRSIHHMSAFLFLNDKPLVYMQVSVERESGSGGIQKQSSISSTWL